MHIRELQFDGLLRISCSYIDIIYAGLNDSAHLIIIDCIHLLPRSGYVQASHNPDTHSSTECHTKVMRMRSKGIICHTKRKQTTRYH